MDELKRPRILFARLQGGAYLHNHYPERYVLKISSLCHDLCLQRTNGRVLPAQWKLLPPSKRNCSDSSEGLNFDAGASKTSFCRRRQRHQLLPLVHNAEHEEEDVHLLLPLVQVTMQSKPVPLNSIIKTQPTNVITGDSPRTHILIRIPTFTASRS